MNYALIISNFFYKKITEKFFEKTLLNFCQYLVVIKLSIFINHFLIFVTFYFCLPCRIFLQKVSIWNIKFQIVKVVEFFKINAEISM